MSNSPIIHRKSKSPGNILDSLYIKNCKMYAWGISFESGKIVYVKILRTPINKTAQTTFENMSLYLDITNDMLYKQTIGLYNLK